MKNVKRYGFHAVPFSMRTDTGDELMSIRKFFANFLYLVAAESKQLAGLVSQLFVLAEADCLRLLQLLHDCFHPRYRLVVGELRIFC